MAQVDGDLVGVSKSCSWPPSCSGSIDTVLEVLLEEGSDSNSLASESISSYEDATGLHIARPTADSEPFEITVAFQRRLCHIRTIYILSSARTCEVYSQQAGSNDVEYVCTARGELFDLQSDKDSAAEKVEGDEAEAVVAEFLGSASCSQLQQVVEGGAEVMNSAAAANEPLYEIEVELVNSDAWAGVRLRLLSLHDKMVMNIKRIIVSAHVGPSPSTEAVDSNGDSSRASSLMAMLMPTMLQMMRSGNRAGDQTVAQNHPATHEKPETRPSALSIDPIPTTAATLARSPQPEAEEQGQGFRNEIRGRLQNLETICSRMESYLHLAFGKLHDRVDNLEVQIRTMQEHSLFVPGSSSAESSDQSVPLQAPPKSEPVLPGAGAAGEEPDHDAREEQEQEDEPEDIQQVEPEDMLQQVVAAQTHSSAMQYSEPVTGVAGEEAEPDTEAEQEQEDEPEDMQQIKPEDVEQIAPAETQSISLDDAWVSALTAFSSSTSEAGAVPVESSKVDAEPDVLVREAGSLIDAELRSPPAEAGEDEGQLPAKDLPNESAPKKELPLLLDMEQNGEGQDGPDKQQDASGGSIDLTELLCSSTFPEVAETGNAASDADIFSDASDLLFLPSYEQRDAPEAAKTEERPSSAQVQSRRSVEDSLLELTPEL